MLSLVAGIKGTIQVFTTQMYRGRGWSVGNQGSAIEVPLHYLEKIFEVLFTRT